MTGQNQWPPGGGEVPTVEFPLPAAPRRRWRWAALGAAAALLAAVGISGYLLSAPTPHTWDGVAIAGADEALRAAESNLTALVQEHGGVVGGETRCYFAGEEQGGSVAVRPELWCGAVYLPDSGYGAYWLSTGLSSRTRTNSGVWLHVEPFQADVRTQHLPDRVQLSRPDGRTPEAGDSLFPPAPPADSDLLEVLEPDEAQRRGIVPPRLEKPVVMRGWDFGVEITGHGELDRFRAGDEVRAAAEGHRLFALSINGIDGESDDAVVERLVLDKLGEKPVTKGTRLRVRFNEGERFPRGSTALSKGAERVLLVSVPDGIGTADMVLKEQGLDQAVDLRTGEADPDNPAVLGRGDVTTELGPLSGELTARVSDGTRFTDSTAGYQLVSARLAYYRGYAAKGHSPDGSAYLVLWGDMRVFDKNRSLIPEWISLRLPDGSTRQAENHTDQSGYVWIAIEVPADFTSGTLVLQGALEFDNGLSVSVREPVEAPLSIAD